MTKITNDDKTGKVTRTGTADADIDVCCPVCRLESCEDLTACLRERIGAFRDLEAVFTLANVTVERSSLARFHF